MGGKDEEGKKMKKKNNTELFSSRSRLLTL